MSCSQNSKSYRNILFFQAQLLEFYHPDSTRKYYVSMDEREEFEPKVQNYLTKTSWKRWMDTEFNKQTKRNDEFRDKM